MIRAFKASLTKDYKILFRSWASIFLVIIGPLSVMLILMLAFSNLGFNNIDVGYTKNGDTKYDQFIPKLSYMGNFIPYKSLDACQQDLEVQKIHLCLEPTPTALNVHFDNSRELISLILLNQIRIAVDSEKEVIMKETASDLLGDVRGVEDFLEEGDKFANLILDDLQEQRNELVDAQDDLRDAQGELENRIEQLEDIRYLINDYSSDARDVLQDEVDETLSNLDSAETTLYYAYLAASHAGEDYYADELYSLRSSLIRTRNKIQSSRSSLYSGLNQVDLLIIEVDSALRQLREAKNYLQKRERQINSALNTIDLRSSDLRQLKRDLQTQRNKVNSVGEMNVDEMVKPLDLSYVPRFLASERLRNLNFNLDLSQEEKQRLVNFGTIQTFLPLVICLLICFIATILANILLLDEIHSPAFLRNQIVPASWITRFLSQFIVLLSVTFIQAMIILLVGYLVFYLDILKSLGTIVIVLLLLVGSYSVIGMIIAYLIRTKTTSLLVSAFFLILNILLGGIVYPVERMAPFMTYLAKLVPFTAGISMLQQSVFYNVSLFSLLPQLARMFFIFLVCVAVLILARKLFLRRCSKGD